jgi:hypothetical protein
MHRDSLDLLGVENLGIAEANSLNKNHTWKHIVSWIYTFASDNPVLPFLTAAAGGAGQLFDPLVPCE